MAHAQFRLPKTAVGSYSGPGSGEIRPDSALKKLCSIEETRDSQEQTALRSLFDRDITKMAVVTEDPKTHASHVGYVDRSGKFTDLTGNDKSGKPAREDHATLAPDGSAVWLTRELDDRQTVASRPIAGNHKAVDRSRIVSADKRQLIMTGTPGRAVLAKSALLTPDGKRVLTGYKVMDLPAGRPVVDSDLVEKKGRLIACGVRGLPAGWLGHNTVLCNDLGMNTFTATSTTPQRAPEGLITPKSDVRKDAMVTSPDGQKFLFRPVGRNQHVEHPVPDYFISAAKPGSKPQKIPRTGAFAKLSGAEAFIDWR